MYEHKLAEAIKDFGNFWEQYRSDIVLRVESVLTEPVCPVAVVEFELDRAPFKHIASCHANTIEEAIKLAIDDAIIRLAQFKDMSYDEIKAKVEQEKEEQRIRREADLRTIRNMAFSTAELFSLEDENNG